MARCLIAITVAGVCALTPAAPAASAPDAICIHEYPHPDLTLSLHPRSDRAFTLDDLDAALRAGVHGIELDLRLRPEDGHLVCGHSARPLQGRPTLEQAIERVLTHRGAASTVQGDSLQFLLFLDLKGSSGAFHQELLRVLRRYAENWSTAVGAAGPPRGITVVLTGRTGELALHTPHAGLDSLCIVEGVDYRLRLSNRSPDRARFQWISIQHPSERGRIRALHAGTDLRYRGAFNVRVYDCHRSLQACAASGADAINVDRDELAAARALTRP